MKSVFLAGLVLAAACSVEPRAADTVFTGAVIWTGVKGQTSAPTAVAVRSGRIVGVGSEADLQRFVGPTTREIDLGGRLVVPGFIDDHTHFLSGGFQLASVDLRSAETPSEFVRRLGDYARTLTDDRWILGGDWDHEAWTGAPLPRREWVDSVTGEHPIAISRLDGHMLLANTRALRLAGITRATQDPPGGTIVRDAATGEPTGILKDEAMALVNRVIPESTDNERDDAFRRAQAHALAHGVTMIQDMGDWASLDTYRRMHSRRELKLRIYSLVPLDSWSRLRDLVVRDGRGDGRLQWGGLKGFVDGSLGSTTAWFYQPYLDAASTSGLLTADTAAMRAAIQAADSAQLQVVIHAIGDRANDWLLDTYAWVFAQNPARDRRFRIEHAQHLSQHAISRFAELGVLPSMQPYHAIDDGRWAEKRIGPERARTTYAFRSLLDTGAGLMFGSDWTVAPMDPLLGIYAAVTRRTLDGRNPNGWVPEQKITVEEALRAYTAANAYGAFRDRELGTVQVGKRADLIVLSDNLLTIDPTRIPEARVDYTIIDGEIVFARPRKGVSATGTPAERQ
jgi:predicted amidohydrolase YtcJ